MAKHKHKPAKWRIVLHGWWKHGWVRALSYIGFSILGFTLYVGFLNVFIFTEIKNPEWGTSFSIKQARNLNLDWQANFKAILEDMQINRLRLMSYWDESEVIRGQLDFKDLDWQFEQANLHGAKISLAIGLRQPRWPECHEPSWAYQLTGDAWKQALYAYMEIVVNRYKNNPALESYQLENEGVNNWFGRCDAPDRQRLIEEFNLVKQWDNVHPVIMSLSDQHGLPLGQPVPDAYGFSVYRTVWNDKFPPAGYITYPTPIWYHRLRADLINIIQYRPVMVHELQMEPWGALDTKFLSPEEQDKSMSVEQISKSFKFAKQLDIKLMYLWGSEWWYWRKVNGDPSIWDAVYKQVHAQPTASPN